MLPNTVVISKNSIINMKVQITSQPRLNRRQQIMIQAKEVYLSDDIPCQVKGCAFCTHECEL